jgi:hypothetical protein
MFIRLHCYKRQWVIEHASKAPLDIPVWKNRRQLRSFVPVLDGATGETHRFIFITRSTMHDDSLAFDETDGSMTIKWDNNKTTDVWGNIMGFRIHVFERMCEGEGYMYYGLSDPVGRYSNDRVTMRMAPNASLKAKLAPAILLDPDYWK